jgi:hypothetical protein
MSSLPAFLLINQHAAADSNCSGLTNLLMHHQKQKNTKIIHIIICKQPHFDRRQHHNSKRSCAQSKAA